MASRPVTVNDLPDGHVALDLECLDRIYLNGYVPTLQTPGQVALFLTGHLGQPVASPALFDRIGSRFRRAVDSFARENDIPVVRFCQGRPQGRGDVPLPGAGAGGWRVAAIGVAQEFQRVTSASRCPGGGDLPRFSFGAAERRVTCYYFYVLDEDFCAGFIKICACSRIRPRSGSTGMSGPSARRRGPGSGSPRWPTASAHATTRPGCRRSATSSAPIRSPCSRNAGGRGSRCPSRRRTGRRAIGGSSRCARSRPPARSSSTPPPRPGVLRRPAARQPRPRPAQPGRAHLRPHDPPRHPGNVRHHSRHPRRRRHHQRLIQALPDQAVLQGRPRPAHRDRGQQPERLRLRPPVAQPRQPAGQSPWRQRPAAPV